MQIISISNQKGGCGKTTTAINLAASLGSLGKKTLLIDMDPQAHATFGLGARGDKGRGSVYNLLTTQEEKRVNFIEDIIVPIDEGLDLVPSHILLSTIEQEFINKDESVSKLHEILSNVSFPYEFVVIDCPPSLGFLTFNALRASNTVIVPVELSSFSLMGVDKLLSMIELIQVKLRHTPKVLALPTMVDMRTKLAKHMMEEIKNAFGEHILTSAIHNSVSVKESQLRGVALPRYAPKSKAALDYLMLSQEILGTAPAHPLLASTDSFSRREAPNLLRDFSVQIENAKEVHLVGDFNNWSASSQSLLWEKEKGVWQKRIFLEPGKYHYKFIIDGRWVIDPQNDHIAPNPYGGMDSVLEIR